jgi:hypothetical protein
LLRLIVHELDARGQTGLYLIKGRRLALAVPQECDGCLSFAAKLGNQAFHLGPIWATHFQLVSLNPDLAAEE